MDRLCALTDDVPLRLRWPQANLLVLLAGLVALARKPLDLGPETEVRPQDRFVATAALMALWFASWVLGNLALVDPAADWAQARREGQLIRRARLTGPEQLERVLQLSLRRPLNAMGLRATGQRLLTLSERHPRIPALLWADAWRRVLRASIADWDSLALQLLGRELAAFLGRSGAPLSPADGLRLLEWAAQAAHFPPGGDPPEQQAVDRLLQIQLQVARLTWLRPGDAHFQDLARQRLVAISMQPAFVQALPVPPAAALAPVIPRARPLPRQRAGLGRPATAADLRWPPGVDPLRAGRRGPGAQAVAPTR